MFKTIHPGEILREDILPDLRLSVSQAAEHLGMSRVSLSRVINGRAGISAELAWRLEQAGISTARMWLALQAAHDLAHLKPQPRVKRLVDVPYQPQAVAADR